MVSIHIFLHHFHWFNLFLSGFFFNTIFSFTQGFIFKMSDIGYISHIPHLIPEMHKISEKQIEGYGRAGMSEMSMTVHCRTADIYTNEWRIKRFEKFFLF